MKPARPARPPWWLAGLACALALLWAGGLARPHLAGERSALDRAEAPLADARLTLAGPRPAPAEIVLVAIDDATVAAEGGYPLPRGRLAALVRAIGAAGARVVALDILLLDPGPAEGDRALAAALGELPAVIGAAGRFPRAGGWQGGVPSSADELWPAARFASVAAVGFTNVATDAGGVPRHLPLVFATSQGLAASFVLRAAALHLGVDPALVAGGVRLGDRLVRLDAGMHLPLRFYGPAGSIPTFSARDVMAGGAAGPALADRVVVVGVTATAIGDSFGTPFDAVTPGAEILATGLAHLIAGDGLVRDGVTRQIDAAAALTLAGAGVLAVALLPLAVGAALAASLLVGWLAATAAAFAGGIWLSAALPLAATVPPVVGVAFLRQLHERRQALRTLRAEQALRRFQPPALADRIAADPEFLAEPVEQLASIVFLDLSGFTRFSERAGPAATRDFLKAFHGAVEDVTMAHGGLVLNFMGDGAMIGFGIPDRRPDDAARALAASFGLVAQVRETIGRFEAGGDLDLRVGAHHGAIVLSRLGHESHQQITASGDSVNVASRLMEVAKARDARLVASLELVAAGGGAPLPLPPDDRPTVALRGRQEKLPLAVWRLPAGEHRHGG